MTAAVAILATGTRIDEYPMPPRDSERTAILRTRPTPEQRDEFARAAAGELVFVRSTAFVEFDAGDGIERCEEAPQGPYPVPLRTSATSALLAIVELDPPA